jgi:hypothetical protein
MVMRTRLTLMPGANGTKKLVQKYGARLVCVRYRYDDVRGVRIKTVELIEEEVPWFEDGALYLVKIPYEDATLRDLVKRAGARWDPVARLWKVTGAMVRRLHLESRVVLPPRATR